MNEVMTMLTTLLCVAILVLFFALITIASDKYFSWYYAKRERKRKTEHPELYEHFDKCNELGAEMNSINREYLRPLKTQIDRLLNGYAYLPEAEKTKANEQLEGLRQQHHTHQQVYDILSVEMDTHRKWIDEYKEQYKIDW